MTCLSSDDAENITNRSHRTRDSKVNLHNKITEDLREHRCGAGPILSEGQVRIILTTLKC